MCVVECFSSALPSIRGLLLLLHGDVRGLESAKEKRERQRNGYQKNPLDQFSWCSVEDETMS